MTAFVPPRPVLAGWLLLVAAGCASSRMTTREIYEELISPGIDCIPSAVARMEQRQNERFHDRMVVLRPWLEAQIGAGEMAAMREQAQETQANTEYIGCPSSEERAHRRTREWTLLHELENRARRTHGP